MAQRTISILLTVSSQDEIVLRETQRLSKQCFDECARFAWDRDETNGVAIHRETYAALRAAYPALPSQLVISARMKAVEAAKAALTRLRSGRKASCPVGNGTIRYDARSFTLKDGHVSLASVAGRLVFPFFVHRHAKRWLDRAVGIDSADLVHRPSGWWLKVVLTIPDVHYTPSGHVEGVDLGIVRPAVTSGRRFLGERRWRNVEMRYFRLLRSLQAKGTKSAKRRLKALSGRRQRFRRDCDHVLSKGIVSPLPEGSIIALEALKGIRTHLKVRGAKGRRRHHGWSYAQLKSFVTYKAEDAGCRVVEIDPRHTSQRCCHCGHVARANRKSQSDFRCQACGLRLNADLNAARNIQQVYLAGAGIARSGGPVVSGPIVATSGVQTQALAASPGLQAGVN